MTRTGTPFWKWLLLFIAGCFLFLLAYAFSSIPTALDEAVKMIQQKHESESKKVLKSFPGNPEIEVMNGRYGAYISYQGSNYKIPRNLDPTTLTEEECQDIIKRQIEKTGSAPKRRIFKTRK